MVGVNREVMSTQNVVHERDSVETSQWDTKEVQRMIRLVVFLMVAFLMQGCLPDSKKNDRPVQPDGWKEKVNNKIIARVVVPDFRNCAVTRGRNVECTVVEDTILCSAVVSFTDGSRKQHWKNECTKSFLIFDDGEFSYFYGWSYTE